MTGLSGSGKTAEISDMLKRFNASVVSMPGGQNAKFERCVLEAKGSWKDLDRKTLHALGHAISAGLDVDGNLLKGDFLHRLTTAGAFRCGLVIDMVVDAVALAVARKDGRFERPDFVAA